MLVKKTGFDDTFLAESKLLTIFVSEHSLTMEIRSRQHEIIKAAGEILTQYGVNGLTTKRLAKKVGFSESALYRHFKGKEEIILTMLHFLAENMDQRLTEIANEHAKTEERLAGILNNQVRFFKSHPQYVVVVFSDVLLEEKKEINDAILHIIDTFRKHLLPLIRKGQDEGIFIATVSAEKLVHIVIGSIRLLMFQWRISDFSHDIEKESENLLKSILSLIKT